ncbi:MAG: NUDIX domain-containing protein [Mycobacteriales bacterium]
MTAGDGSAWVDCGCGERHWGRFGAAGLLLRSAGGRVLLQLRSARSDHGGTWGLPGGARDGHESVLAAALREAAEETGLGAPVRPAGVLLDDHGPWSYATVVADIDTEIDAVLNWESDDVRWMPATDIRPDPAGPGLPLHPGLAAAWLALAGAGAAPMVIVDAANVVGSRPDGWWRDRLGAAARLRDRLASLAGTPIPAGDLPVAPGTLSAYFPRISLVVEGRARDLAATDGVDVVPAPGSGDDTIVGIAGTPAAPVRIVVTADRKLRERVRAAGAHVTGPRWLLDRLDQPGAGSPPTRTP